MLIINFIVCAEILSLISIIDLKKAYVCISNFCILKTGSNKTFLSDIDNIIFKPFNNDPDSQWTFFGSDTNVFSNKTKKDLENTKLKLIKKKIYIQISCLISLL